MAVKLWGWQSCPHAGLPAGWTRWKAWTQAEKPAPHLLVLCLVCAALAWGQKPAVRQMHVPVPMRDGVRLSANVFLPSEHARVPTILVRTPYGKGADITSNYQAFVDHGYAVMVE